MSKPFRGIIYHWWKVTFDKDAVAAHFGEDVGEGYCIAGYLTDPPHRGSYWRTSWVLKEYPNEYQDHMIETRNSIYELQKKAKK